MSDDLVQRLRAKALGPLHGPHLSESMPAELWPENTWWWLPEEDDDEEEGDEW